MEIDIEKFEELVVDAFIESESEIGSTAQKIFTNHLYNAITKRTTKQMTPEEKKARELVDMFYKLKDDSGSFISHTRDEAKQCALICVNEMIEQNGELYLKGIDEKYYREKNAYLFGVKQEIQKL